MVSIRDIAKQAGYSISTVSRYLNQSGYVSDEAAEKIATIVKELDYSPNQIARDLSSGHTRKIGVVVPHVRHTYFTELIQGLLDAALESHYQLLFLPSDYSLEAEQSYLELLRGKAVDALIFTSRAMDIRTIASYRKYGPIVCMEETDSPDLISISVDRRPGYLELFDWLQRKNPQKVALLFSRNSSISPTYRETMAVFEEKLTGVEYVTYGGLMRYEDAEELLNNCVGRRIWTVSYLTAMTWQLVCWIATARQAWSRRSWSARPVSCLVACSTFQALITIPTSWANSPLKRP